MQEQSNIIFFDIETASEYAHYDDLTSSKQSLRDKKSSYEDEELTSSELYSEKAAIYPEFGRIVCISYGGYDDHGAFTAKSFAGDDEKQILSDFFSVLREFPHYLLCGHNIKGFDIPYLCKRGVVHGLRVPRSIQVAGKKPRDILHIDTLELWKFGNYRGGASLALLCELFDIPTPKDDIDGSQVSKLFREEKDTDRIARYCEKDIIASAKVYKRLKESMR